MNYIKRGIHALVSTPFSFTVFFCVQNEEKVYLTINPLKLMQTRCNYEHHTYLCQHLMLSRICNCPLISRHAKWQGERGGRREWK